MCNLSNYNNNILYYLRDVLQTLSAVQASEQEGFKTEGISGGSSSHIPQRLYRETYQNTAPSGERQMSGIT